MGLHWGRWAYRQWMCGGATRLWIWGYHTGWASHVCGCHRHSAGLPQNCTAWHSQFTCGCIHIGKREILSTSRQRGSTWVASVRWMNVDVRIAILLTRTPRHRALPYIPRHGLFLKDPQEAAYSAGYHPSTTGRLIPLLTSRRWTDWLQ